VDVETALRGEANNGVLDEDLVLEHVHPTLRGYFLLADAYFDALVNDGLTGPPRAAVDDAQAWLEVPVSEVDRLFAEYKIARITSNWPFIDAGQEPPLPSPDSVPAMLAQELYRQTSDWPTVHRRLADHYESVNNKDSYAKISLILADAFPFNSAALFQAGVALMDIGRNRQALSYLYRGAQRAPRDTNVLLALSHALLLNGARDTAREILQRVLALEPGNLTAQRALSQLEQ
ncbi:MAG: hypothetical protein OES99_05445, partial [Gammaproteobacteria bacterium]|nr:hypothetical protein [Gammaproteobacteria bacterium]